MTTSTPSSLRGMPPLAALALGLVALAGLYLTSLHSYLLFHTVVEVFLSVVGAAVFVLAWNTRWLRDNHYLTWLGIAFLFVSLLHVVHALAYKGMTVFPERDANLPTQLWIASRYMHSLAFLTAPLFIQRRPPAWVLALGMGGLTALLLAAILVWGLFPDCFVEGRGLTRFKVASEYVIIGIYLAAWLLLLRNRKSFDPQVARWLGLSLWLSMAADFAFTAYVSVYGPANLIGHLLMVAAAYLVFKALVETGLRRPFDSLFRELKQSAEQLRRSEETARALLNAPEMGAMLLDAKGTVLAANRLAAQRLGAGPGEVTGRDIFSFLEPSIAEERRRRFDEVLSSGRPLVFHDERLGRRFHNTVYPVTDAQGGVERVAAFFRDVTETEAQQRERERLLDELQTALAEVKTLSGLLPICAHCKRIRDEQGNWSRVETYISRHSQAQFSHGICPECYAKHFPDY